MFRCQLCGRLSPSGDRGRRVVTHQRRVVYPFRSKVNIVRELGENGRRRERFTDDPGGEGLETVREVVACASCASADARPAIVAGPPPGRARR
jgi:hypothetical protein